MQITNVLVHVDNSKQFDGRIAVATSLAKAHDAHLAAIYPIPSHPEAH
jgi:hypothetical protein